MHSRLFELNTEKVSKSEWTTELDICSDYEWFCPNKMDYINEITSKEERKGDIEWLLAYIVGDEKIASERYANGKIEIHKSDIENFFARRYDQFKKAFDKFNCEINESNFGDLTAEYLFGEIEYCFKDEYGFQIKDGYDITPLNEWLRWRLGEMTKNNKESLTYYVCQIFDFHY